MIKNYHNIIYNNTKERTLMGGLSQDTPFNHLDSQRITHDDQGNKSIMSKLNFNKNTFTNMKSTPMEYAAIGDKKMQQHKGNVRKQQRIFPTAVGPKITTAKPESRYAAYVAARMIQIKKNQQLVRPVVLLEAPQRKRGAITFYTKIIDGEVFYFTHITQERDKLMKWTKDVNVWGLNFSTSLNVQTKEGYSYQHNTKPFVPIRRPCPHCFRKSGCFMRPTHCGCTELVCKYCAKSFYHIGKSWHKHCQHISLGFEVQSDEQSDFVQAYESFKPSPNPGQATRAALQALVTDEDPMCLAATQLRMATLETVTRLEIAPLDKRSYPAIALRYKKELMGELYMDVNTLGDPIILAHSRGGFKMARFFNCIEHRDIGPRTCKKCIFRIDIKQYVPDTHRVAVLLGEVRYSNAKKFYYDKAFQVEADEEEIELFQECEVQTEMKRPSSPFDFKKNDYKYTPDGEIRKVPKPIRKGFVEAVKDKVYNTVEAILEAIMHPIRSYITANMKKELGWLNTIDLEAFALLLYDLYNDERKVTFFHAAIYLVKLKRVVPALSGKIREFVTTMMANKDRTRPNEFETESFESSTVVTDIIKFICGLFGTLSLPTLAKMKDSFLLFNQAAMASKNFKSLANVIINALPRFLTDYFDYDNDTFWRREISNPNSEWNVFIATTNSMALAATEGTRHSKSDVDTMTRFYFAFQRDISLRPPSDLHLANYLQRSLTDTLKKLQASPTESCKGGFEPIFMMFIGKPGLGKSAMVLGLVARVFQVTLSEARSLIYTRNAGSDFWDGYIEPYEQMVSGRLSYGGHHVVVYDDLGAINSPIAPEADYAEIVNLVTGADYMLPMASLTDTAVGKKGARFGSKLILACTNSEPSNLQTYKCMPAFERRRECVFNVTRTSDDPREVGSQRHLGFSVRSVRGSECHTLCKCVEPNLMTIVQCSNCLRFVEKQFNIDVVAVHIIDILAQKLAFGQKLNTVEVATDPEFRRIAELSKTKMGFNLEKVAKKQYLPEPLYRMNGAPQFVVEAGEVGRMGIPFTIPQELVRRVRDLKFSFPIDDHIWQCMSRLSAAEIERLTTMPLNSLEKVVLAYHATGPFQGRYEILEDWDRVFANSDFRKLPPTSRDTFTVFTDPEKTGTQLWSTYDFTGVTAKDAYNIFKVNATMTPMETIGDVLIYLFVPSDIGIVGNLLNMACQLYLPRPIKALLQMTRMKMRVAPHKPTKLELGFDLYIYHHPWLHKLAKIMLNVLIGVGIAKSVDFIWSRVSGLKKIRDKKTMKTESYEPGSGRDGNKRTYKIQLESSEPNVEALSHNLVSLQVRDLNRNVLVKTAGYMSGMLCITPVHSFIHDGERSPQGYSVTMFSPNRNATYEIELRSEDIKVLKQHACVDCDGSNCDYTFRDVCVLDLTGGTFPAFKDKYGHMYDLSQLPLKQVIMADFVTVRNGVIISQPCSMKLEAMIRYDKKEMTDAGMFFVPQHFTSQMNTQVGDCGGIYVYKDKIVAMHFAAIRATGQALSMPLTKEYLEKLHPLRFLPSAEKLKTLEVEGHEMLSYVDSPINIPMGIVQEPEFMVAKTRLRPGELHGVFSPTHGPPVLSPHDTRMQEKKSPLAYALKKYNTAVCRITPSEQEQAINLLIDYVLPDQYGATNVDLGRDYTLDEVVGGNVDVPFCDAMDMSTSAGRGYIKSTRGKSIYFEQVSVNGVPTWRLNSGLGKDLLVKYEQLKVQQQRGIFQPQTSVATLKDELLKLSKITEGKSRVFHNLSVHSMMNSKRFWGPMFTYMLQKKNEHRWMSAGIDPYSSDWNDMMRKMFLFSEFGWDADYTNYDAHNARSIIITVGRAMARFMHKEGPEANVHILELCTLTQIAKDVQFAVLAGTISGHMMTTIVNSLSNIVNHFVCWLRLAKVFDPARATAKAFYDNVWMTTLGDDFQAAVAPSVLSWYNFLSVKAEMAKLGHIYTIGLKEGEERPYMRTLEMSFLKNTTGVLTIGGSRVYVPLIDLTVINKLVNWIRTSDDDHYQTESNLNTALRFMFFYGRVKFNELRQELLDYAHGLGLDFKLMNWDELYTTYYSYMGWGPTCFNPQRTQACRNETARVINSIMTFEVQSAIITGLESFIQTPLQVFGDVLDVATDVLSLGALDKPNARAESLYREKQYPNLNTFRGVDSGTPFKMDPKTQTQSDKYTFASKGSTSLASILERPTPVTWSTGELIPWKVDVPVGTILYSEEVNPCIELVGGVSGTDMIVSPICTATALAGASFWRGDIMYNVQAFATKGYHKGTLIMGFAPRVFDLGTLTTLECLMKNYYMTCELGVGENVWAAAAPYTSPYQVLQVRNTSHYLLPHKFSTGTFFVAVVKPLVASQGTTTTVNLVVRKYAGKNYEIFNKDGHNMSVTFGKMNFETVGFEVESSESWADTMNANDTHVEVTAAGANIIADEVKASTAMEEHVFDKKPQESAADTPQTLLSLGQRLSPFAVEKWTGAQTVGTIINMWDVPLGARTTCDSLPWTLFWLWTCRSITITVQLAGSPFYAGHLYLVWLPLVAKADAPNFLTSSKRIEFMRNVIMQPWTTTLYTMKFPFVHPQDHLDLSFKMPRTGNYETLGTLALVVGSPLLAGAGVTGTVQVNLHSSYEGVETKHAKPCCVIPAVVAKESHKLHFETQGEELEITSAPVAEETQVKTRDAKSIVLNKSGTSMAAELKQVTRNQTASHFTDKFPKDIMTLCKRWQPALPLNIPMASASDFFETHIDVANDLLFADGSGSGICGAGDIGKFACFFRAFKGDVKIRITLSFITHGQKVGTPTEVTYHATAFHTHSTLGAPAGALDLFQAAALSTGDLTLPMSSPHRDVCWGSSLRDTELEFEINYNQLTNFTIIPNFGSQTGAPYSLGHIIICGRVAYAEPYPLADTIYIRARISASLSDTAHFGIPFCLPTIKIKGKLQPDWYDQEPTMLTQDAYAGYHVLTREEEQEALRKALEAVKLAKAATNKPHK